MVTDEYINSCYNDIIKKKHEDYFQDTTFAIGYDESPGHTHSLSIESVKPDEIVEEVMSLISNMYYGRKEDKDFKRKIQKN